MGYYEILVETHIDPRRLRDFQELTIKPLPDGNTLFFGKIRDQAELFSVLNRIRDMNLTLISVMRDAKTAFEEEKYFEVGK